MVRWFVIPMRNPSTPDGRGTLDDPWRPKYLQELGLTATNGTSFRYWVLVSIDDAPALDTLAAYPDVHEITDRPIPARKRTIIRNWLTKRGVTADLTLTGQTLVDELFRVCREVQVAETPAIRASLSADMTS